MERYCVIFNDVPLSKENIHWDTVYLPKQVTFNVSNPRELYKEIDRYILETNINYSSYEISLIK